MNWDLWVHLFHAELYTLPTTETRTRRAVRAGGMSLAVRRQRKDDYIPNTMTTNNADWERGWFYLHNAEPGLPPYTGLVLRERPASWYHGVSPPQHQARLDSLLAALRNLAGRGLTAEVVLTHLHHRRIVLLMERPLCIYEMTEDAYPVALAKSRSLPSLFPREYAATRARCAIDPKFGRYNDRALWDLEMLPTSPLVRGVLDFIPSLASFPSCQHILMLCLQMVSVSAAKSEPPTPPLSRALTRGAAARAGAGGPQAGARDATPGAS
jgi:hypothetical protein